MPDQRLLTLYNATSVDGYIASDNYDLGFLSILEEKGEDYGYVDAMIMDRKIYDRGVAMGESDPHPGRCKRSHAHHAHQRATFISIRGM